MEEYIKVLNYQPHSLPKQFIVDPDHGIRTFFSFHPIPEAREKIRLLFRAWIRILNVYSEPDDISSMLLFQEQLIEFLEVSYIKGIKDGYISEPKNQPKE